MLTIEPGLLIWTIITFVILLAVLGKLAWKPLLGALEQRETTIRESLEKAEQARLEAEELMAQNRQILAEANRQANRILAQAQEGRPTPPGFSCRAGASGFLASPGRDPSGA